MPKVNTNGTTRIVLIFKNVVVKIPNFRNWNMFLRGLLANLQESSFSKLDDKNMAPVKFCLRGGWFLIMQRCQAITLSEWEDNEVWHECTRIHNIEHIPVEMKRDSFGYLNGTIVALDYGS